MYRTKDSELVAYLRSCGHNEKSVSLEPDLKGKIKVYFFFDDSVQELVKSFENGTAVGNIREYITAYKKVIEFVIGIMGTGKPL